MIESTGKRPTEPHGRFMLLDGERYYRISDCDGMPPFLMSIASDSDLWMFVSSSGGLTAGRVDPDGSLFPYETVDRLYDAHHHTGPITLLRVQGEASAKVLWQPFCDQRPDDFDVERNLYKNIIGNRVVFEEINHDLGLSFRYRWSGSDAFGWLRTATLRNHGGQGVAVSILDGLRNILPWGAPLALHQQASCLVDAYKRTDYDPNTRLAVFSLTAKIIDRPEPAESLRANAAWWCGHGDADVCLSSDAVAAFRRGELLSGKQTLKGQRGNYLVVSSFDIDAGADATWHIAADVGQDHIQLAALRERLAEPVDLDASIERGLAEASANLVRIVGSADGLQLTGHTEATAHHFASVLYNNMRGGVFADQYNIDTRDLVDFITTRNRAVAARHDGLLAGLAAKTSLTELGSIAASTNDSDLQRLGYEYLPIAFSRRHGDPSRPWNRFSIRVRERDGTPALRYQGNWRDIFQNWEALSVSFPLFLPSMIAKFVNASTVDGFNPYRIARDAVDWEVIDPNDPWSHIGYWGDHQIVYLLKFLESLARFSPRALEDLLDREIFCYAEVPYRLKTYDEILANPRSSIIYDSELAARVDSRVRTVGTDGKLVTDANGSVYHVTLLEKLLVPVLSKLSNFVPDGGIWMNTQRPEWNDANNALAGNGLSVVTVCYLRRHLVFIEQLLREHDAATVPVSIEVVEWLQRLRAILDDNRHRLSDRAFSDADRKLLLDALGKAFSRYRDTVYSRGFSGKKPLAVNDAADFCRVAIEYVDHTIRANRRPDGMVHTYNIMSVTNNGRGLRIHELYEMLEGQVAALSSGVVDAAEAVGLLSSLFKSRIYRPDQHSFLLYPERDLPDFFHRNIVAPEAVRNVPLLHALLDTGDTSIVARDAQGVLRFSGDFNNAADLSNALDRLATEPQWTAAVADDRQAVLDVFEGVFQHESFTGRSGTMYGYEGLGCIYWHMVLKLLLAVQEIALRAERKGDPAFQSLAETYYRVRQGLGFNKTVSEYGAFPTDPYSHTPRHAGAQQPGMTGQVKEDILTRLGELGVRVEAGAVSFRPVLLRRTEFLREMDTFRYYDVAGTLQSIDVPASGIAFTFCQVPVVYELTGQDGWIRVTDADGVSTTHSGNRLEGDLSSALFARRGVISRIDVGVPKRKGSV